MTDRFFSEASELTFVIPARNEERIISDCLEACVAQTVLPHEVIVVEHGSSDRTSEVVEGFAQDSPVKVSLLQLPEDRQPPEGVGSIAANRSFGFDSVRTPLIGRIDADTIVHPDWVKVVTEGFASDPDVVAMHGRTGLRGLSPGDKFWGKSWMDLRSFMMFRRSQFTHIFGHNMALRKDAWDKAKSNISDDHDNTVLEDLELSFALAEFGAPLYEPKMIAKIIARRSMSTVKQQEYLETAQTARARFKQKRLRENGVEITLEEALEMVEGDQIIKRHAYQEVFSMPPKYASLTKRSADWAGRILLGRS